MSPKILELLSPAKNLECGLAAIKHGADAVYIGGPKFGAREDAGNSIQDIEKLVKEAHFFKAKVYTALNTILYDNELEEVQRIIWKLYETGVDALIIQDFGILEMDLPSIALHASTQMHNYKPGQLKFLEGINFKRAVLARELSLDQIKEIRSLVNIELEAFVHGSLCVSFSGRCYLSYANGGRSANRGACAQPCRKPYMMYDADKKIITANQHLLSLKDLNHSGSIKKLAEAGIQSFKIEGRLKDVDYVKNVTSFYRRKIDELLDEKPEYSAASLGKVFYGFDANLSKTFNRGGTGYFLQGRSEDITSLATPKFLGEEAGIVTKVGSKFFEMKSSIKLSNNDGLVFIAKAGESIGIKVNVAEPVRIFPDKMNGIYIGAKVYRNYDHVFQQQLKADLTVRKIGIGLEMKEVTEGFEFTATVEDGTQYILPYKVPKYPAKDIEKSEENIVSHLSRSGDTSYLVTEVYTNGNEKYFFQASVLNGIRRDLLDKVTMFRVGIGTKPVEFVKNNFPYPQKEIGYEANISNQLAVKFYRRHGVANPEMAFEKQPNMRGKTVMTMKHCLKYSLGFCPRFGGTKPTQFTEPFFLNDGKNELKLDFDCGECVMKVIKE